MAGTSQYFIGYTLSGATDVLKDMITTSIKNGGEYDNVQIYSTIAPEGVKSSFIVLSRTNTTITYEKDLPTIAEYTYNISACGNNMDDCQGLQYYIGMALSGKKYVKNLGGTVPERWIFNKFRLINAKDSYADINKYVITSTWTFNIRLVEAI